VFARQVRSEHVVLLDFIALRICSRSLAACICALAFTHRWRIRFDQYSMFLGDAELNKAVANTFATAAGYTPLDTAFIIQESIGKSIHVVEQEEGRDPVVIAEASVLEQTALQLRCSISTLGGGWGATARQVTHWSLKASYHWLVHP
jgi:hypothetical protein